MTGAGEDEPPSGEGMKPEPESSFSWADQSATPPAGGGPSWAGLFCHGCDGTLALGGAPAAGPGAAGTCVSLGGKVRGAVPAAPWPGPAGTAIWVARCESAGTGPVPPVLALWSG